MVVFFFLGGGHFWVLLLLLLLSFYYYYYCHCRCYSFYSRELTFPEHLLCARHHAKGRLCINLFIFRPNP